MTTPNTIDRALTFAAATTPEQLAALVRADDAERTEAGDALADAITTQVQALKAAATDAIANTRRVRAEVTPPSVDGTLPIADRIRLVADNGADGIPFRILPIAHDQLAAKTSIPRDYWWRMVEHQPDLAVANVNRWLAAEPEDRLFRLLKPITDDDAAGLARVGGVFALRAVLGATYRPMDHASLVDVVLGKAHEAGAFVTGYDLDDRRFHMRVVRPAVDVFSGQVVATKEDEQALARAHKIGEWVRVGFTVRNSETGFSSLAVEPFAEVVRCFNGIIIAEKLAVRHVGGRQLVDDDAFIAADTRRLDDAASFAKVRDRVVELFSDVARERVGRQIAQAAGTPLALPAEVPLFTFVENVGRRYELTEAETRILQEETTRELMTDPNRHTGDTGGRLSKWSVAQAMTATARRIGETRAADAEAGGKPTGNAFDRRTDLERAGWQIITDPTAELMKAAQAAVAKPSRRRN